MSIHIRRAEQDDLLGILEIYNHAIRELPATFDTEEKTLTEREQWLAHHGDQFPVFVAVDADRVVGWASLSPFSDRLAYARTVENSVYVHPEETGHGIGTLLMAALMDAARTRNYHAVIAKITGANATSIALHRKFGFVDAGVLREVGWKFDRWHDVVFMEALL